MVCESEYLFGMEANFIYSAYKMYVKFTSKLFFTEQGTGLSPWLLLHTNDICGRPFRETSVKGTNART